MQNSKNDRFRSALTDAVTKRQHQRLFYRTPSFTQGYLLKIFFLFFHIVSFFSLSFPLCCAEGLETAFFHRQGKTGFCRVGFLLCLYCFRLILLSFFLSLSLSLPLSLCRFPFVVPGFWSGVFPPAGEDRLLPCWVFIVFVLFSIDFVVFFSFPFPFPSPFSLSFPLCCAGVLERRFSTGRGRPAFAVLGFYCVCTVSD